MLLRGSYWVKAVQVLSVGVGILTSLTYVVQRSPINSLVSQRELWWNCASVCHWDLRRRGSHRLCLSLGRNFSNMALIQILLIPAGRQRGTLGPLYLLCLPQTPENLHHTSFQAEVKVKTPRHLQ